MNPFVGGDDGLAIDGLREHLVQRRKELGLTQAEVARTMGTTQSALSDLEHGRNVNPRLSALARWAVGVGIELSIMATHHHTFPIVTKADSESPSLAGEGDSRGGAVGV